MKTDTKKTGTKNAQSALADINAQIVELQQKRVALAEPLKQQYGSLRNEMTELATEITALDSGWKPEPTKPKAESRIAEVITTHGAPMAVEEIVQAVGDLFTSWKVKNVLKKKSTGAKAVFTLADGKYGLKVA
jgi:hypothetical protein